MEISIERLSYRHSAEGLGAVIERDEEKYREHLRKYEIAVIDSVCLIAIDRGKLEEGEAEERNDHIQENADLLARVREARNEPDEEHSEEGKKCPDADLVIEESETEKHDDAASEENLPHSMAVIMRNIVVLHRDFHVRIFALFFVCHGTIIQ